MARVHYTDLLSATEGRLVSRDGMEGVCRVFDAVAGPGVTTLAILYLGERVKAHLRDAFPETTKPIVAGAIGAAIREYARTRDMGAAMDKYVRPHLSAEWYDVPPLAAGTKADAEAGYGDWLGKKLAGKDVIVVRT
jgi:hypothetical protein